MTYRFGRFEANDSTFRLSADGDHVPLEPKAFRLLLYLLQNKGRLVRKQELLDTVWSETSVTESALTRAIGMLRKALKDDSREPHFIETVPTEGYRFIAVVEAISSAPLTHIPGLAQAPAAEAAARTQTERWIRVAGLVAVCGLAVAAVLWRVSSALRARPLIRSIAVLPLANLSGDPGQQYFAEGMTDELITEVARIPNLRVVSRTSVMADASANRPLPDIARALGVDAIVEGSTVRSGDRVRITAQLIDARTDRHLWAHSFEGSASDVLALQDSVAEQIASQARLALVPQPSRPTIDPAAQDAYLRARYFFHKQDMPHSLEYYEKAISIDTKYASAYAGYATALDSAAVFGLLPEDALDKALAAASRAIALDPNNGEAYTALGSLQIFYLWDWSAAEQNLTRGISLNPNDPVAEFKYAVYLDAVGRPHDAVLHMRRAVELDPLSFYMNRRLGATLYLAREYDAALAQLARADEMEHSPASVDSYRSFAYEKKGERDLAVQYEISALKDDRLPVDTDALGRVYREHGWAAFWNAKTEALRRAPDAPCTAYEIGVDDLRVNENAEAFAAFNRAIDRHCFNMAIIRVDPLLDSVRGDARFAALLKRIRQ